MLDWLCCTGKNLKYLGRVHRQSQAVGASVHPSTKQDDLPLGRVHRWPARLLNPVVEAASAHCQEISSIPQERTAQEFLFQLWVEEIIAQRHRLLVEAQRRIALLQLDCSPVGSKQAGLLDGSPGGE